MASDVLAVVVGWADLCLRGLHRRGRIELAAGAPTLLRGIQLHDRVILTPGLIVILLAGIYLLIDGHISAGESWVTIGFIAIIALFGMVHGFFRPNTARALELAERDLDAGDTLSAEYTRSRRSSRTAAESPGRSSR